MSTIEQTSELPWPATRQKIGADADNVTAKPIVRGQHDDEMVLLFSRYESPLPRLVRSSFFPFPWLKLVAFRCLRHTADSCTFQRGKQRRRRQACILRMYPEPYLSYEGWNLLRREIESHGFVEDTILQEWPNRRSFGMNLAFGWPLPSTLKEPYERTERVLSSLDSGLYVYPYHQTHVTVMTLINFKNHVEPSDSELREFLQLVPVIVSRLTPLLSSVKRFSIDVGPPVFSRRAGFLPILNQTREISTLRSIAGSAIQSLGLPDCNIPEVIHSTIVRFLQRPADTETFLSAFESLAESCKLGQATVDEFLLTSETKPYMRAGEILHRFRLGS